MNGAARLAPALLLSALAAARLCHSGILWTEEGLPMAAAVQMLHGKALYRDIWFDKPPLVPAVYLLWGAHIGIVLRLAGALFVAACCWAIYRFAADVWTPREGWAAALLLAFFLTFGIPAAVLPLAADFLMLLPHLIAVHYAWRGRAFASGIVCGVAFLSNAKALFVLAACALWVWRRAPLLLVGFALPNAIAIAWLAATGALYDYWEQVWHLGSLYSSNTFVGNPVLEGITRTANWAGFHSALALGAAICLVRCGVPGAHRWLGWALLSIAAVAAGWRFFPRYYLQLLPVAALLAARGWTLSGRAKWVMAALLLIPAVRFGPRYATLAADLLAARPPQWSDVAMDLESRAASRIVASHATPGDTLFVWGYRPDICVYTRMPAETRYLESQPLTGVFADRHLFASEPLFAEEAQRRRNELARTRPAFIVDGLSLYNPSLAMQRYPELRDWFAQYERIGQTGATVVYRRR